MKSARLHGLYAITDPVLTEGRLFDAVSQSIKGGASIIQYRNKSAAAQQRLEEARALQNLCQQHNVLFIINDDPALALQVNADGVHVGQQDAAIETARKILGKTKIIGVSCNNRLELAQQAEKAGADYVAFGRFFPSRSKPTAPQAKQDLLRQAKRHLSLPIVAIGGITPQNAASLLEAGADMLAVINNIFAAKDIMQAASCYTELFAGKHSVCKTK